MGDISCFVCFIHTIGIEFIPGCGITLIEDYTSKQGVSSMKMKAISLRLDEELHRRLKKIAEDEHRTITNLIQAEIMRLAGVLPPPQSATGKRAGVRKEG